ncbi:hypothetical protein TNCT_188251 [Trichonephila clavata]|uniref:Uncharacterized protein n=1 Tax=Trichonephila clavata TaxID=2740835 RepID=A0A8X6HJN6_TRICU|nr:hypothetical protein TNCT_188251 [Trichonephila clavata]
MRRSAKVRRKGHEQIVGVCIPRNSNDNHIIADTEKFSDETTPLRRLVSSVRTKAKEPWPLVSDCEEAMVLNDFFSVPTDANVSRFSCKMEKSLLEYSCLRTPCSAPSCRSTPTEQSCFSTSNIGQGVPGTSGSGRPKSHISY